jgi:glycosyltransferase involved in cell wall biosynthesis
MARQRIALLGGHGGRSGVPRHIHQLCNLLSDRADITVFSDINDGGYDFTSDLNVNHVVIPGLSTTLNPARLTRVWRTFCAALDTQDPFDVLWAHARLSLPMARRFVRKAPIPPRLIATYHGSPFAGRSAPQLALARKVERDGLTKSLPHDLVFLSQTDRATFSGLPLHRHTIHEIANCSDLGALPPLRQPLHPTVMMTTRASRQKNLYAAARIFGQLPNDYRLILRGMETDTFVRSQFMRILGDKICQRITFGGPISDVRPDLVAADCYLLTSHYEGLSIGALEAFEAGLPVAMPQIGGAHEFSTHHPQSAIIDPRRPVQSANALHQLVSTFRDNRTVHVVQNRAAWSKTFHPSIWAIKINTLLNA